MHPNLFCSSAMYIMLHDWFLVVLSFYSIVLATCMVPIGFHIKDHVLCGMWQR